MTVMGPPVAMGWEPEYPDLTEGSLTVLNGRMVRRHSVKRWLPDRPVPQQRGSTSAIPSKGTPAQAARRDGMRARIARCRCGHRQTRLGAQFLRLACSRSAPAMLTRFSLRPANPALSTYSAHVSIDAQASVCLALIAATTSGLGCAATV